MKESKEEGNKIIAEFMGNAFSANWNLRYHFSWDALMPVVEKIIDIDITPAPNWTGYRVEIVPRGYVKISGFPMPTIHTNVSVEGSLINAVWLAVVEFIKFFNKNKTQQP